MTPTRGSGLAGLADLLRPGLDLLQIAQPRFVGTVLLTVLVFVYNRFIADAFSARSFALVASVLLAYAVLVRIVLTWLAGRAIMPAVNTVFLATDVVMWTVAIYATGGETSW